MSIEHLLKAIDKSIPVVDIRDSASFKTLHLKTSANIPWTEFFQRLSELPDPAKEFIVIADSTQVAEANSALESRRHKPSQIISWQSIQALKLPNEAFSSGCSCTQLWSANPLLSELPLSEFPSKFAPISSHEKAKPLYVDLGCGAGRELVYMAQKGFQAIGFDRMLDCRERASSLAAPSGAEVEVIQADIEHLEFEPKLKADVISVFRFLHRPLLKRIDSWLLPQGHIVYQTFMQGCEKFGSPKNPNFLLKPNELAEIFSNYDIKVNRVDHLADGRPMQSFIAQKR